MLTAKIHFITMNNHKPIAASPVISSSEIKLPVFSQPVRAGFPSPAEDYIQEYISLDEHLIKHPSATYLVRAKGESMILMGIFDGDLLIVDRSLEARSGDVVIAALDNQFTCKILDKKKKQLIAANSDFKPIQVPADLDLVIEGVVINSIRYFRQ